MGAMIAGLLQVFSGRIPDAESNARVLELARIPERWSAGHRLFDEVRARLLIAEKASNHRQAAQYYFEESCLQAIYNATDPRDPFDPSSAFFVVVQAIGLGREIGIADAVIAALFARYSW